MKILICDDEIEIVNVLKKCLESKGLLVNYALDGKEALRLIKERDYDIVFLDHNMPEITGMEIIEYIKEKHIKAKTVILTGYPDLSEYFCKTVGADEYLEKPIDLKVIEEIIDKYKKG